MMTGPLSSRQVYPSSQGDEVKSRFLSPISAKAAYRWVFVLSLVLAACGEAPTFTDAPASAAAPPLTATDTQPPAPPAWKTFNHGDYTLKYPPDYYLALADPVVSVADTQTTYDSWMRDGSVNSSGLLIQLVPLALDRRLDPDRDPSQLATKEQAIQREINRTVGVSYDVDPSTDVPWENAGGETYAGRKVFYPSVPYEGTVLGTTPAAKVVGDNALLFFILVPNDDSYFVRITIQPTNSALIAVANRILSTFAFAH
jgi:hypothetical protein